MSSGAPKFIDVTGFPDEGEHVPPTARAAALLVAQGWTAPKPIPADNREIGFVCYTRDLGDYV
ncbi:hypothetical protein QFZ50_001758 [Arthrobacter agilis]|nr:hypothetical protein [Arthrobacter agilis]